MEKQNILLVNPESKGYEFGKRLYEEIRKKDADFEVARYSVRKFRDGEFKVKILDNVREKDCYLLVDSNLNPSEWWVELIQLIHTLKISSANKIIAVLPYMKFARQDRKDESRVPITAKALAKTIEIYANRVLTLDIHNPAIQGFYDIPFDNLQSFPTVINHLRKNNSSILNDIVVMSTDTGGADRAKKFTRALNDDEIVIGYKERKVPGEVEKMIILGNVRDKNVLIIDDLIDSGGSLTKAAEVARNAGAKKVYAYCTHALFTKGLEGVAGKFDELFVGNTVETENHPNIEKVDFVPLFAEAIHRLSTGRSLSALFEVKSNV